MERFRDARQSALQPPCSALGDLAKHVTQCDDLKKLLTAAEQGNAKITSSCADASLLATTIMFTHQALVGESVSFDEVQELTAATKADFGFGTEALPSKLLQLLPTSKEPEKKDKESKSDNKGKKKEKKSKKEAEPKPSKRNLSPDNKDKKSGRKSKK